MPYYSEQSESESVALREDAVQHIGELLPLVLALHGIGQVDEPVELECVEERVPA